MNNKKIKDLLKFNDSDIDPTLPRGSTIPSEARKKYDGIIFDVYEWEQEQFDGSYKKFEALKRADTVNVISLTPANKFIVTREEQPYKGEFFAVPGGRSEPGESPQYAVERELFEETGMKLKGIKLWYSERLTSKIDWYVHVFIGWGAQKVSDQNLDKGEKITVDELDYKEFIEFILDDRCQLTDLKLRIAKQLLKPGGSEELFQFLTSPNNN